MKYLFIVLLCLFFPVAALAEHSAGSAAVMLPEPGAVVLPGRLMELPVLKALKIDSADPLHFRLLIDPGTDKLPQEEQTAVGEKLMRYFLTALTLPEADLWVNLSPVESGRVITPEFSVTEMGRTCWPRIIC